jgi:DNA-binding Xre family transcriptional regulator
VGKASAMIKLQVQQLLIDKGIENPNRYLMKNGFSRITSYRILTNDLKGINFEVLEDLCMLLQCTPNDLLSWYNSNASPNLKDHPLQLLKRKPAKTTLSQKIKEIPLHKLEDLRTYIDKLSQPPE